MGREGRTEASGRGRGGVPQSGNRIGHPLPQDRTRTGAPPPNSTQHTPVIVILVDIYFSSTSALFLVDKHNLYGGYAAVPQSLIPDSFQWGGREGQRRAAEGGAGYPSQVTPPPSRQDQDRGTPSKQHTAYRQDTPQVVRLLRPRRRTFLFFRCLNYFMPFVS